MFQVRNAVGQCNQAKPLPRSVLKAAAIEDELVRMDDCAHCCPPKKLRGLPRETPYPEAGGRRGGLISAYRYQYRMSISFFRLMEFPCNFC